MRDHLQAAGVSTFYIEPDAPWQNGYAESFSGRFRDDLLESELFADLREARVLSAWWKNEYNHRRPHSSPGYRTPAQFAASHAGPPLHLGAAPLDTATDRHATEHQPALTETGT